MAFQPFSIALVLSGAVATVYTVDANKYSEFDLVQITNASTVKRTVRIEVTRAAANGGGTVSLAYDAPIDPGESISPVAGGLRLRAGDSLRVGADTAGSVHLWANGLLWDAA